MGPEYKWLFELLGFGGVLVAVLFAALKYIPVMGAKLDEANEKRANDLKGVIASCTVAMNNSNECMRQLQEQRKKEIEVHEEQSRETRRLADVVDRISDRVQCANMTPAHGVPRVRGQGD